MHPQTAEVYDYDVEITNLMLKSMEYRLCDGATLTLDPGKSQVIPRHQITSEIKLANRRRIITLR